MRWYNAAMEKRDDQQTSAGGSWRREIRINQTAVLYGIWISVILLCFAIKLLMP
jgi:hypothetical protein